MINIWRLFATFYITCFVREKYHQYQMRNFIRDYPFLFGSAIMFKIYKFWCLFAPKLVDFFSIQKKNHQYTHLYVSQLYNVICPENGISGNSFDTFFKTICLIKVNVTWKQEALMRTCLIIPIFVLVLSGHEARRARNKRLHCRETGFGRGRRLDWVKSIWQVGACF